MADAYSIRKTPLLLGLRLALDVKLNIFAADMSVGSGYDDHGNHDRFNGN